MKWARQALQGCQVRWWAPGGGLLLCCGGWTALSRQFQYGQGHVERPIIEYVILYFGAWLCFAVGFVLLNGSQGRGPLVLIVAVGVAARLLLVPSALIQENDVYRYVLDGQTLRHGVNPFQYSPLVVSDLAPEPLKTELQRPEAMEVLSRIGYPQVPTLYPPAAQWMFAAGAALGGWSWMGQRWLFLILDLFALGMLLALLPALGVSRSWILLYAWNPLVLKEVVNSVHLDAGVALSVLCLVGALWKYSAAGRLRWAALSGVAAGLAVLSKWYPVLLVPAGVFFLKRRSGRRVDALVFVAVVMGTLILGFLPFWGVGFEKLTQGLSEYAGRWTMNAGAFSLVSSIFGRPRVLCAALIAALSLLVPWLRRSREVPSLLEDFQWVILLWFLFIPTPFPWYALVLMVLLPLRPGFSPASAASLLISGVFGLYYLSFYFEYHDYSPTWWMLTRGIEHAIVWVSLAAMLAYQMGFKLGVSSAFETECMGVSPHRGGNHL